MRLAGRIAAAVTVVGIGLAPGIAQAAWSASGSAQGNASATTVNKANAPTATKAAPAVALDWAASTLATGTPVTRYDVVRHSSTTSVVVCTSTTLTCQDTSPLMGRVTYGVVARSGANWVSPESDLVSFTYDTTAPVTAATQSPAANGAGWNKAATTVALNATDTESGVRSISYSVNGGQPTTVTGSTASVLVSTEGSTAISYSATDNVGNTEATKTVTVKLDKNVPTATATGNPAPNGAGFNFGPVAVTMTGSDATSGVASMSYQVGTASVVTVPGSSATVTVSAPGTTAVQYWDTDIAGNVSSQKTYTVNITTDTTAPTANVTDPVAGVKYKGNSGTGGWDRNCGGGGGICGTASDAGSGVAAVTFVLMDTATNTCWSGVGATYTAAACSQPIAASGTTSWSYAVPFEAIAGRDLSLTVTARDAVGLTGSSSRGFSGR